MFKIDITGIPLLIKCTRFISLHLNIRVFSNLTTLMFVCEIMFKEKTEVFKIRKFIKRALCVFDLWI